MGINDKDFIWTCLDPKQIQAKLQELVVIGLFYCWAYGSICTPICTTLKRTITTNSSYQKD